MRKLPLNTKTLDGKTYALDASGIESVCLQHELDHLDGIVFIEKLSPLKQSYLKREVPEIKKEVKNEKA